MKRKTSLYLCLLLSFGATQSAFADDDSVAKQIQMLNSQLQAQLQQIQEKQKKLDNDFNAQIQAQLKEVQTTIQKQINDAYTKTQAQIKTVQDNLQAEIKQVTADAAKAAQAK